MIKIIITSFIISLIVCNLIDGLISRIRYRDGGRVRGKSMSVLVSTILLCVLVHFGQIYMVTRNTASEEINLKENSVESILNSSKEIELKKKIFSFRKHYYVLVDDVKVGEIKGKLFNIFGDVLEFRDNSGKLIKKESQIKRLGMTHGKLFNISFDRLAKIEDSNGVTGYIGEQKLKDLFKFNHIQYFYDSDYNKKGSAKRDFPILSKDYKITDNNKNVDYIIDGTFFSIFNNYEIEVKDSSDVDAIDALFYTIIEDSIIDSKTNSSTSSAKSTSKRKK